MTQIARSIPKPLVQVNQMFIVLSVLTAWIIDQYLILLLPLTVGLTAVLFGFNPVVALAKNFLQKPLTSYVPEDYDQQQFNQWIAVICLILSIISFSAKWQIAGFVFSGMVFAAAAVALSGFCIGCFIRFQWQQFNYRRKNTASDQ